MVEYSAAIAAVESELIVRSSHSAQGNPHTIEEVRRILRLHAGLKTGPSAWATVNCRRESNNRVRRYTLRPVTIAPLAGFLRIFLVVLLLLTAAVMTRTPRERAVARAQILRKHPVGINFLLLGYGYLEGDVAFDASSPLKDAEIRWRNTRRTNRTSSPGRACR